MLRFTITFVIAALALTGLIFVGDYLSWGRPIVIYDPFFVVLLPVLRRAFGGGEDALFPAALCTFIVGTLLYSALFALAVTWLLPSGSKRKKP